MLAMTKSLWVLLMFVVLQAYAERTITVTSVIGDVTFKRGETPPKPVRVTTRLKEKDVIRTRVESSIEVRLDDGSVFSIQENSVVDLAKLVGQGDATQTKLHIQSGKVLFQVKKLASKKSDFEFETPTATAAIRGTMGGIGTTGKQVYAYLEEGRLALQPRGGGVGVVIRQLNLAIQSPKGFIVKEAAASKMLLELVQKIEEQVKKTSGEINTDKLDSMVVGLKNVVLDSLGEVKPPVMDTMKSVIDTSKVLGDTSMKKDSLYKVPSDTLKSAKPDTSKMIKKDSVVILPISPRDTLLIPTVTPKVPLDTIKPIIKKDSIKQTSVIPIQKTPLFLEILSPVSGEVSTSQITVSGKSLPSAVIKSGSVQTIANSTGQFSFSLQTPAVEGSFSIQLEGSFDGQSMSKSISLKRVFDKIPLRGTVGPVPSKIQVARLHLTGTCASGATIYAGQFTTRSTSSTWALDVSWPESDEGRVQFEVFCALSGEEIKLGMVETEYSRPAIPLTLKLNVPKQMIITSPQIVIYGVVTGRDVKVEVAGQYVPVASGMFNYKTAVNSGNWDLTDIEVVASDGNSEVREEVSITIDKKNPLININKPKLLPEPSILTDGTMRISASDDRGDEGDVYIYVDGDLTENWHFQGSLSGQIFKLQSGSHDYRVEAKDQAGNMVTWTRSAVAYYPRVEWSIDITLPRSDVTKSIPNPPPGVAHKPTDNIRFRINSLPDNDYRYLKEVRITNEANGVEKVWRDLEIDDVEFEYSSMPLVPKTLNRIVVRVEPKTGPTKTVIRTYNLR